MNKSETAVYAACQGNRFACLRFASPDIVKEEVYIADTIKRRNADWIGHISRRKFFSDVIELKIEERINNGKTRK
jgi:hypothetical protein